MKRIMWKDFLYLPREAADITGTASGGQVAVSRLKTEAKGDQRE
jgi:hypothetical protein